MDKIRNFILSDKHNQALPGEKHQIIYLPDNTYSSARYSGAGTRLDIRLPKHEMGLSYVDNVAKRHDIEYLFAKDEADVKRADEHMMMKLDEARAKKLDAPFNINQAELIRAKYYANRLGVPTSFFTSFGKDSIADQSIIPEAERQLQELIQQGYGKHRPRRLYKVKQGKKTRYYYKSNNNDSPMYVKSHGSGNNIDRSTFIINMNNPKPVRKRQPKKPTDKTAIPVPVGGGGGGGGGINMQATKKEVVNAYAQGYNVGLSKEDRRGVQDELDKIKELETALQDQGLSNSEKKDLTKQLFDQRLQMQMMRDGNPQIDEYVAQYIGSAPPSEGGISTATTIPDVRLLQNPRLQSESSMGLNPVDLQSESSMGLIPVDLQSQSQASQASPDTSTVSTQTEKTDISQPVLPPEIDNLNPLDNTPDPNTMTVLEEKLGKAVDQRENPRQVDDMVRQQEIQDFIDRYNPSSDELDLVSEPKTSKGVQQAIQLALDNRQGVETKQELIGFNDLSLSQLYKIALDRNLIKETPSNGDPQWEQAYPDKAKKRKAYIKRKLSEDIISIRMDKPSSSNAQSINDLIRPYQQQEGFGNVDTDGISTSDIESMMRRYNHISIPVIPSDMINTVKAGPLTKEVYFIMNLDPHDKPGSHWVAVAISNMDKSIMYYDSLCIHPTHQILQDLKRLAMKMDREHMFKFKFNTVRDQSKSSGRCGFFAMQFLHKIINGKTFKEASMYNRHYKQGEHEIQKVMHGFGYL